MNLNNLKNIFIIILLFSGVMAEGKIVLSIKSSLSSDLISNLGSNFKVSGQSTGVFSTISNTMIYLIAVDSSERIDLQNIDSFKGYLKVSILGNGNPNITGEVILDNEDSVNLLKALFNSDKIHVSGNFKDRDSTSNLTFYCGKNYIKTSIPGKLCEIKIGFSIE